MLCSDVDIIRNKHVPVDQPLVYINSLMNVSVAFNQGDYAAAKKIASGEGWSVEIILSLYMVPLPGWPAR